MANKLHTLKLAIVICATQMKWVFAGGISVPVSVNGVPGSFNMSSSQLICSGRNASVVGECPGPQSLLPYGSCCVQLPNRNELVMGCVPRISEKDTCSTQTNSVISSSSKNESLAEPTTDNSLRRGGDPFSPNVVSNQSTHIDNLKNQGSSNSGNTSSITADLRTESPTASPTQKMIDQVVRNVDTYADAKSAETGNSTFTTLLFVSIGVVAVIAIIGGVLVIRKKIRSSEKCSSPAMTDNRFTRENGYGLSDTNISTPKEDVVCL
jgi:hypothetical protein